MKFSINNEFGNLKKVVLGLGNDSGGVPKINEVYDPHSNEEVNFSSVAKIGGLLRCSTLPLIRL